MQDHGINVDVVEHRLDFSKCKLMCDLPEFVERNQFSCEFLTAWCPHSVTALPPSAYRLHPNHPCR
jgi:hypothetical protein